MWPVQRHDRGNTQTPLGGDDRRVNRSQHLIAVSMDKFRYAQPIARPDRFNAELARGQISEKSHLGCRAKTGTYQVAHLGYHQSRHDQPAAILAQECQAGMMVAVVGVYVGVDRTRVYESGYRVTSDARISSIRSEMSVLPLRPAPFNTVGKIDSRAFHGMPACQTETSKAMSAVTAGSNGPVVATSRLPMAAA